MPADRREFLGAIKLPDLLKDIMQMTKLTLDDFLKVMPADIIKDMNERGRRQDARARPDPKLAMVWNKAMSLPASERPRFDIELKAEANA